MYSVAFRHSLGGQFKTGHPWAVQNRPVAAVLPGRSFVKGSDWLGRALNLAPPSGEA